MKQKIPEEIMIQRRKERLKRLNFFILDKRANFTPVFALHETHNLLTGFFQNSKWQTAWFCVKQAFRSSWTYLKIDVQFFYYYKILRLTPEQVEKKLDTEN